MAALTPLVLSRQDGAVATVTLNRPERHNSLVPALLEQLLSALQTLSEAPELRALVLDANGGSFSTGGDVRAFYEQPDPAGYSHELVGLLNQAILTMLDFPVPIICAVQGPVSGGSLGLVLASDLVLVTHKASFAPYYNVVGFSPDGGWTALLPQVIGPRRTAETLLLNRTIAAAEAVAWGLATRLVSPGRLHHEAQATAQAIANLLPGSIRRTRALLNASRTQVAERLELERQQFVEHIASPEAKEGMAVFLGRKTGGHKA